MYEANYLINSEEWFILMPKESIRGNHPFASLIYGDQIIIDARTDVDALVVSYGDKLTKQLEAMEQRRPSRKVTKLQAYQLKPKRLLEDDSDFPYRMLSIDTEIDQEVYENTGSLDMHQEGMTAKILKSEFNLDQAMVNLE